MKRSKILIADNDSAVAQEICAQVTALGLETLWVTSGREVIKSFIRHTPDVVILRDDLPDLSGWETARLIRAISDTPIVFIADHPDRLSFNRALQLGDDFMTAPWQWERLPGRLAALLKRTPSHALPLPDLYDDGYLMVDISGHVITRNGKPVPLSNTEFKMLACFVRHPNCALTYSDLLQSVWGHTYLKAKSDVSQYVRYLRQKIEAEPVSPTYFQSIRSIGYLFVSRM
jgi:two-component system response regulator MtrA